MQQRSPIINVMTSAARKASRRLLRDFGEVENLQVSKKGPADFVSNADIKAEETLRRELEKARPDFGFLLEEGGIVEGKDKDNRWIIDPLDGTLNFLHGIPHFSISIAHECRGRLLAGIIYDPVRDEMFMAERGLGAFVNDRRLRVSARSKLDEAVLATGIPFLGRKHHPATLNMLESVMTNTAGIRRFGSAALDLAYVAAGRYEGFWESDLKPWDIAAGLVIVMEAGGLVAELTGGPDIMATGNVLATNEALHEPITKLLRTAIRENKNSPS